MTDLPPYTTRDLIQQRLLIIFPKGTPNRTYCTRELAASTIFTMLYIGAVEDANIYLGPVHVYRMTFEQAALVDGKDRNSYRTLATGRKYHPNGDRWYADNTREPIRDETIREGLLQIGAVFSKPGIPTTSGRPRYFLQKDFANLFDPELSNEELSVTIESWQKKYLSKSALTRISLANYNSEIDQSQVLVTFPNKSTRSLTGGPSAIISKAVIEAFAPSFLESPVVLWLSTSDDKVVAQDDKVALSIGLRIQANKDLPDIILVDLGPPDPLLIFVEVVATDGAITERRQKAIYGITDPAGFARNQVAFMTAYLDKDSAGFKKTISNLAWDSFAWFISEPEKIVFLKNGVSYISKLINIGN